MLRSIRQFVPPAIIFVVLLYSYIGFPWEPKQMTGGGAWWQQAVPDWDRYISHPILFFTVLGIAMGVWGWPLLREFWERPKAAEEFAQKRSELGTGKAIADFFRLLERAYGKWRPQWTGTALPSSAQTFLDDAPYPHWAETEGLTNAGSKIDRSDPYWAFAYAVFDDVETYRRTGNSPRFLTKEEADEFQHVNMALRYFWLDVASKVENWKLRYRSIRPQIDKDQRVIKAIVYFSICLYVINNQKYRALELYKLAGRYFAEKSNVAR